MISTKFIEPSAGYGNVSVGALRGVSASTKVRLLATTAAPKTGEVRPQAGNDVQTPHLGDGFTDGVCVRTWRPPV